MINVLVMSPCSGRDKDILNSAGKNFNFVYVDENAEKDLLKQEIDKAEIIIGEPEINMIQNAPDLKLIQMTMAGTDKYTRNEGFPSHIMLANASGAFGGVISQYTVGAILNICHKFHIYRDNQKKSLWEDMGMETSLSGKRVLIIGAGNIGSSVAYKLSVFGTVNIGIRRNINEVPPCFSEMHTLDELDEQLPLADIVVACIPNSDYTYHLFDEKKFRLMKKDAIFVNVGRGALVVQDDLVKVLNSGHLKGVVLDVTDPEPLPSDNPLWGIENVVITPHISGKSFGHSQEITDSIYQICVENLINYSENKPIKNLINFSQFKKQ